MDTYRSGLKVSKTHWKWLKQTHRGGLMVWGAISKKRRPKSYLHGGQDHTADAYIDMLENDFF